MKVKAALLFLLAAAFLGTCGFADKEKVSAVQYAGSYMNVYEGPGEGYAMKGVLYPLQEIAVLGGPLDGYCKIAIGGSSGYVSAAELLPYETAKTALYQVTSGYYTLPIPTVVDRTAQSDIMFVGDSRTMQMLAATEDAEYTWIGESTRGYEWFVNIGIPMIDEKAQPGSRIVLQLGVNDLSRAVEFAGLLNQKAMEWEQKGAHLYVVSVNPIDAHQTLSNDEVVQFNNVLRQFLLPQIEYLDTYSYLKEDGYLTLDGVHYDQTTYQKIFHFILNSLNPGQGGPSGAAGTE